MKRKAYSASAVKTSFWFMEFRKVVGLLTEGKSLDEIKKINQNDNIEVPVPNYYWKVLLKVHRDGGGNIIAASTIGFWVEHKPIAKADVMQYSCSVNQIEKYTGFNFFVNLPEGIEEGAESNSDLNAFKSF